MRGDERGLAAAALADDADDLAGLRLEIGMAQRMHGAALRQIVDGEVVDLEERAGHLRRPQSAVSDRERRAGLRRGR